ncbi:hypothetical protein EGW08_010741 [Elysia chlorotica]|uniref:Uncharacterized protein n=1 Tax=Elysia chlorotica TaxID=188477 RepID=A0A3S0ZS78_ELYCH|nr:hypothetical protein EGW08_010741 [Elysia chlorotica]
MPQHLTTRTKQLGVRKLAIKDIDFTQYSVKSTFARVPQSRIVLCPWRVFSADPESVSDSFRELDSEDLITYADDINVMLNVEGMKTPEFGMLDDFSQTWIIQTDEINLDNIIEQIKSHPILLGVTLTNRKLLGDHEEIPVVAFLDHKTPEVREAVMKLETCRDELQNKPGFKFCVEVDIGETVSRWASEVLGQSMTSVGGRFCVTNGETVNHMFDWSNICAFLPVICCCAVAIPIYKLKRKATYDDFTYVNDRTTVLKANTKSKLKPARKPSVNLIQVDYAKDQDKKPEEPKGIQRQDSYMQAEDLDTIARAFKMSKTAAEPRPSVVSPVTLSNFRADLLFGDVESDEETERSRRGSVASNFLDPNYEEEMGKFFKSAPNPLTNIELMQFLTTKNKPAAQKSEDELRKIELAKKKRSKVGKGWATAQTKFNDGKMNAQKE